MILPFKLSGTAVIVAVRTKMIIRGRKKYKSLKEQAKK